MNQKVELKIIEMSEVESKEISWLWYPFIPYGKLTIIQGDPGDGKTTLVLNIVAALSKGEGLDEDMKPAEPLRIIYQTAEDGLADTVKPRLGVFSFTNPNGLIRTDGGSFLVSDNSGEPQAASRADYTIYQGSLESSNVELSQEMTNLIVAQRAYQFSSKVVTTADEIEQLVNSLRG